MARRVVARQVSPAISWAPSALEVTLNAQET